MICLCASLSLCVPFALVLLMPPPHPPLSSLTSTTFVCDAPHVIPLIVLVSPSLYLHSRSRLSASSSSSSWRPPEAQAQGHLLCCWAPGPRPLQPRAREAWSSLASSESAVAPTCRSVPHRLITLNSERRNMQYFLFYLKLIQSLVALIRAI